MGDLYLLKYSNTDKYTITESFILLIISRTRSSFSTNCHSADFGRLTPSAPSFVVPEKQGALDVMKTYLVLGIEHILMGIDHLLFVLALILIVKGWRKLVGLSC